MKKRFKQQTKKTLTMKKKDEAVSYERFDIISPETSQWVSMGGGRESYGKYITREMKAYEVSW